MHWKRGVSRFTVTAMQGCPGQQHVQNCDVRSTAGPAGPGAERVLKGGNAPFERRSAYRSLAPGAIDDPAKEQDRNLVDQRSSISLRRQALDRSASAAGLELHANRGPERARRQVLRGLQQALDRLPPGPRPACAAGCALCCHLRVAVTPVEVFGLLDHLRANATPEAMATLSARMEQAAAQVHALAPAQRLATNIACPVLVEGRCSAYSARPFNCRAYHSLDLAACEASFANPEDPSLGHPQDAAVARVHEGTQAGFMQALRGAGLDAGQYELATALAEAMADPAARRRFEAGGQAFLKAVRL